MILNVKHRKETKELKNKDAILIIDDEEIVREILLEVMEIANFRAYCAQTGKDGIEIFTRNRKNIKLILLDMVMPGLSGLETYQKLLALDPHIKIILMSGYPNKEAFHLANLPENQDFIQKPFSVQEVISKVRQSLA